LAGASEFRPRNGIALARTTGPRRAVQVLADAPHGLARTKRDATQVRAARQRLGGEPRFS
jgi:hypothetical protein